MITTAALTLMLLAQGQAPPPPDRPAAVDVVAALETALADAIARAEPSVVAIHRKKNQQDPNVTLAVRGRPRGPRGVERDRLDFQPLTPAEDFISFDYGSGVVIGDKGEILTAFHVVRGAERLLVHASGAQAFDAEVIAADPRSDLAVIAPVEDREAERPKLKSVAVGDSTKLRKGSFLIALGNSFNAARDDGTASAGWGILSNVSRRLEVEPEPFDGSTRWSASKWKLKNYPTLLQLDARLNLGMSGGAVINIKGELVGITTTAASPAGFDAQAGYAIPMDRMGRRVVETLKQGKEVEYGLLGIVSDDAKLNRITNVSAHSPAGRGIVQIGDEILAINGVPTPTFDSLILIVGAYTPGDTIHLKIRRSNNVIERDLMLAKYPIPGEVIATNRPKPWRGLRVDYSTTMLNNGFNALEVDAASGGVVAVEVEEGSPAAAAGIKKGVLIIRAAGRPVLSPRAFADAVEGKDGPVALDTEIGTINVGTPGSPAPKPPAVPRVDDAGNPGASAPKPPAVPRADDPRRGRP